MLSLLCVTEKSGKEVMSKGSSGMEVILASLEVSSLTQEWLWNNTCVFLMISTCWLENAPQNENMFLCNAEANNLYAFYFENI